MRKTSVRAGIVGAAAVAVTALVGPAAQAAPATSGSPAATANQSDCRAWVEERIQWPLRPAYRVGVVCSSIDPAVEVRGTADLPLQIDEHTPWFTDAGQIYYTTWRLKWFGPPEARIDYQPR